MKKKNRGIAFTCALLLFYAVVFLVKTPTVGAVGEVTNTEEETLLINNGVTIETPVDLS